MMEIETTINPQYVHDCSDCTFLGQLNLGVDDYDLYFCPRPPYLYARYDHHNMVSGLLFVDTFPALSVAYDRVMSSDVISSSDKRRLRIALLHTYTAEAQFK